MSSIGSTSVVSSVSVTPSSTGCQIFNVSLPLANAEYSQALPSNTKGFELRVRELENLKISFAPGDSGTTYWSVRAGTVYTNDNFFTSQTIYFQSPTAGVTLELVAYT